MIQMMPSLLSDSVKVLIKDCKYCSHGFFMLLFWVRGRAGTVSVFFFLYLSYIFIIWKYKTEEELQTILPK